jgi:hypothetical protein
MLNPLSRCLGMAALAAVATLTWACTESPSEPRAETAVAATRIPVGPMTVEGEHAGARYGLFLPADWNGDLVIFARGYDMNATPTVPTFMAPFRDALLAEGYAFAWTSNAQSRFAIDDAVTRGRQLATLFGSRIAHPAHTYVFGQSLGSATAVRLAQTSGGGKFDGVVTVCGPIAGMPLQLDYYLSALVLFRYYYPHVQIGSPLEPLDLDPMAIAAAIGSNLAAAAEIAAILGIPYANPQELLFSVVDPVWFATSSWFTGDVLLRTGGLPFFDNGDVLYAGSSDDAALNAGIERFTADPVATALVAHWYAPDGRLQVPMITLHNPRDPVVPLWHETTFAQLAASAGAADLLLQRTYDRFDHCAFTVAEQVAAVNDLASWVKTGVRPAE